jgi:hypothetical protein
VKKVPSALGRRVRGVVRSAILAANDEFVPAEPSVQITAACEHEENPK